MRFITITLALLLFVAFVQKTNAHGGVQKISGNTAVTFYQSPISPLVGEEVKITFVVSDRNFKRQPNLGGKLTLIDTYYGDESKDKVILTKPFKTDANGAFEFAYTFDKENYFNIDLQFDGQNDKSQHIDYLIQPRNTGTVINKIQNLTLFEALLSFGIGFGVAIIGKRILETNKGK